MRRFLVASILVLTAFAFGPAQARRAPTRIALVHDGPWAHRSEVVQAFKTEIEALCGTEFPVVFPEAAIRDGQWTPQGARTALDAALADPDADIVITLGPMTSLIAVQKRSLPKPTIAAVTADVGVKLPRKGIGSGVKNLNYVAAVWALTRDMALFAEVVPFKRMALLLPAPIAGLAPEFADRVVEAERETGVTIQVVIVGSSGVAAVEAIAETVDAVYVAPLFHLQPDQKRALIDGLNGRRLPTFSRLGRKEVEAGMMVASAPASNMARRARRVAIAVQSIQIGEPASKLPVGFAEGEQLVINMATARAIGKLPTWRVLAEAELLNRRRPNRRKVSLEGALNEGLSGNLDLRIAVAALASGRAQVDRSRSNLLPQISVSLGGRVIDADRAAASNGLAPEGLLTGSAKLSQVIWSDGAWAGFTAEQHLQDSRDRQLESTRLDTAYTAATAYLDVLKAQSIETVRRANAQRTRQNLELARTRLALGQGAAYEVYRWESQLAIERREAINAQSRRHVAELTFNAVLNRPLEEGFETHEHGLEDPTFDRVHALDRYFNTPTTFAIFRDFMVSEALAAAPELKQIDAAMAAQQRILTAARRRYWSPTLAAQGEISHYIQRFGDGKSAPSFEIPGGGGFEFQQADDTNWSVALNLSIPLYEGGDRSAATRQAEAELTRLGLRRDLIAQAVDRRCRSALHIVGASSEGIDLTRRAAKAARKNLELVTDAYRRGATPLVNLIDAQDVTLEAEQGAALAVYQFLSDLMAVERATGRFDILSGAASRAAWLLRLQAYYKTARKEHP